MTNTRAALEQIFFALGTTFTCFVILMSSTLHAHTLGGLRDHSVVLEQVRSEDPEINAHAGLIEVEAMLPHRAPAPTEFCFADPKINACIVPQDLPSLNPEFLPASLEADLSTVV